MSYYNSHIPTLVFISAPLEELVNLDRDLAFFDQVPVLGAYKGLTEASRMVHLHNPVNPKSFEVLKEIAAKYNQESILVRNSDGSCELHYTEGSGRVVLLPGRMKEIDTEVLPDSYTVLNDKYYTVY